MNKLFISLFIICFGYSINAKPFIPVGVSKKTTNQEINSSIKGSVYELVSNNQTLYTTNGHFNDNITQLINTTISSILQNKTLNWIEFNTQLNNTLLQFNYYESNLNKVPYIDDEDEDEDEEEFFESQQENNDLYIEAIKQLNQIIQYILKSNSNDIKVVLNELNKYQILRVIFDKTKNCENCQDLKDSIMDLIEELIEAKQTIENSLQNSSYLPYKQSETYNKRIQIIYNHNLDLLQNSLSFLKKVFKRNVNKITN